LIKKLTLENFQNHVNDSYEFSPSINIITGSSNSGKTSLFRAIYYILENRPKGTSRIRHGESSMSVELETDKGVIKRFRNKTQNAYEVQGVHLEAMGGNVPKEVLEFLNLSDLNIQKQFSEPFLLGLSPAQRATELNNLLHLEDAEVAQDFIRRKEAEAKKNKKELESRIEVLEKELRWYSWVEEAEKLYDEYKDIEVPDISRLQSSIEEYCRITAKIKILNKILKLAENLEEPLDTRKLRSSIEEYEAISTKISVILDTISKIKVCPTCGRPI